LSDNELANHMKVAITPAITEITLEPSLSSERPVYAQSCWSVGPMHARLLGPVSRSPGKFSGRKAIFRSSVSKNGDVYTPETSDIK